jgi:hypothetical protein
MDQLVVRGAGYVTELVDRMRIRRAKSPTEHVAFLPFQNAVRLCQQKRLLSLIWINPLSQAGDFKSRCICAKTGLSQRTLSSLATLRPSRA